MGALTSKPMAFSSRNWEYQSQLIYDLTDFLTPRIRVDQFNGKVYRILPTVEWISNRIRFLYLGLRNQRIINPKASYSLDFEIILKDKVIYFYKKVMILFTNKKVFELLKNRFSYTVNKNINLVCGNLFQNDLSVFRSFENEKTRVYQYSEISKNFKVLNSSLENLEKEKIVLFSVNPRMESPLLNLKLKEIEDSEIISLGNFSYSFPVKVLANNNSFFLHLKKGFLDVGKNTMVFFGLSSLDFSNMFSEFKTFCLVPLYLFNNAANFLTEENQLRDCSTTDQINLYLSVQNLCFFNGGLNVIFSSHFENKITQDLRNFLTVPVSSYLEGNLKFLDKDLKIKQINSLKPNFNLRDFVLAFKLYCIAGSAKCKTGFVLNKKIKQKIKNKLVSNSIPNYLIRDPLGRANPLFNSII